MWAEIRAVQGESNGRWMAPVLNSRRWSCVSSAENQLDMTPSWFCNTFTYSSSSPTPSSSSAAVGVLLTFVADTQYNTNQENRELSTTNSYRYELGGCWRSVVVPHKLQIWARIERGSSPSGYLDVIHLSVYHYRRISPSCTSPLSDLSISAFTFCSIAIVNCECPWLMIFG